MSSQIQEHSAESAPPSISVPVHEPRRDAVNSAFLDYYRCPENFADLILSRDLSANRGFFQFGRDAICYGQSSRGSLAKRATDELYDTETDVVADQNTLRLPFNPSEIVANLRYERYVSSCNGGGVRGSILRKSYYLVRPFLPVSEIGMKSLSPTGLST